MLDVIIVLFPIVLLIGAVCVVVLVVMGGLTMLAMLRRVGQRLLVDDEQWTAKARAMGWRPADEPVDGQVDELPRRRRKSWTDEIDNYLEQL